uniref:TSA: Wollemia nobilis Ref_Wollemi_Transcript_11154_592 transcribed RNA sequence n=1 Tax=Wollemia nobilis TaxID=56998 RepID=A0A0C9S6F0_9CONI
MAVPLAKFTVPKPMLKFAYLLGYMMHPIYSLLRYFKIADFPEPQELWPIHNESESISVSVSSQYIKARNRMAAPSQTFGAIRSHTDRSDDEESTCAVCLKDFCRDEEVRLVSECAHIFHKDCLDEWVFDHDQNTCPLCRSPVRPIT